MIDEALLSFADVKRICANKAAGFMIEGCFTGIASKEELLREFRTAPELQRAFVTANNEGLKFTHAEVTRALAEGKG